MLNHRLNNKAFERKRPQTGEGTVDKYIYSLRLVFRCKYKWHRDITTGGEAGSYREARKATCCQHGLGIAWHCKLLRKITSQALRIAKLHLKLSNSKPKQWVPITYLLGFEALELIFQGFPPTPSQHQASSLLPRKAGIPARLEEAELQESQQISHNWVELTVFSNIVYSLVRQII